MASVKTSDSSPFPSCPNCKSSNYRKAGKNSYNKQQMLRCLNCGRSWTLKKSANLKVVEKGLNNLRNIPVSIPSHIVCTRCNSNNLGFAGWCRSRSGKTRRLHCKDCDKYFPCADFNYVETYSSMTVKPEERKSGCCPKCGYKNIGTSGRNSSEQKLFFCKTCSARWVADPIVADILPELECPNCHHKSSFAKGGVENGVQRYICKKCYSSFIPFDGWVPQCPDCGSMRYKNHGYFPGERRYYRCQDCDRCYSKTSVPKVSKDPFVIDSRNFGVEAQHHQSFKINLDILSPPWFKEAVQKYITLKLSLRELKFHTLRDRASMARRFSHFLEESYPGIESHEIDRSLMIEIYASEWWNSVGQTTQKTFLGFIRELFEYIDIYDWGKTSGKMLVAQEDYPKSGKIKDRHIPESVMDQIAVHLPSLPEPFQRAITVLIETGMRFSELSGLKQDCLEQDRTGGWWLTSYQSKMDKEHRVPIQKDCAFAVQEQRKFVQDLFGNSFEYLFCGRSTRHVWRPKTITLQVFNRTIQVWAEKNRIISPSGKIWHLTSHQFRHTLATRMINAKVAQPIVQRYLGHESSQMTQHYAHLHDRTLQEEFNNYHGKVVDVKGKIYSSTDKQVDSIDLQWFRSNIQAQALPNGSCGLPTVAQACPHANACLTCTHFRTSNKHLVAHKEQLESTEEMIAKAEENGWGRQVEMNEKVATNLRKIIDSLENP